MREIDFQFNLPEKNASCTPSLRCQCVPVTGGAGGGGGGWGLGLRDCGAGLNTSGQGTVIELHSSLGGCEDEGP